MTDALPTALAGFASALMGAESAEDLERRYKAAAGRLFPGRDLGFYLLDPDTREVTHFGATGVSDFFLARYEEAGRPVDPLLAWTLEHASPVTIGALMSREDWLDHPMYGEVCHLHGLTRLIESPILAGGRVCGTLYFAGRDGTPEPSRSEVATAGTAGCLVGLAVQALAERTACRREHQQVVAALELCDEPVVIQDLRTGRRRLNAAARALLARIDAEADVSVLDEAMAGQRQLDGGELLACETVLLCDGERATLTIRSLRLPEDPTSLVSFLHLDAGRMSLPPRLAGALTPREREVAHLVIEGLHDAEIAQRLVISPHTVNQHLKRVYAKLGVDGRVRLTRLALAPRSPASLTSGMREDS